MRHSRGTHPEQAAAMGFLRRLFGGGRAEPSPLTAGRVRTDPPVRPAWVIPGPGDPHPNAPAGGSLPSSGAPERWRFVVPDGIAVLNSKNRNVIHTVRLNGTNSAEAQEILSSLVRSKHGSAELLRCELRTDGTDVAVFNRNSRLGTLPSRLVVQFGGLVAEAERTGWKLVTWVDVLPPTESIAAGGSRSGPGLVAEARLPSPDPVWGEPLFADAYDASFAFPHDVVFARRKTPEGKAEFDAWWAANAVKREFVAVRIGAHTIRAARLDWAPSSGGATEGRGLRLMDPATSAWLYDDLPDELIALGMCVAAVAGISHYPDRSAPAFAAERPVRLVREPDNRYDPNAIAVRSADGRLQAGHLPRETAAWATNMMRRTGGSFFGIILWEFRVAGTTDRAGLRVLTGPVPIRVEPAD